MKNYLSEEFFDLTKLLRRMKATFVLFVLFTSSLLANTALSQNARVNIALKNARVIEVLKAIENQTDYLFVYDQNRIDLVRQVDVEADNETVAAVLGQVFDGTDVQYSMVGTNIVLLPQQTAQQQAKTVSGRVTDFSGSPLPGVSVVVKGTTNGTITDIDGNYSLTAIPEDATLIFSFIGMKTQEVAVAGQSRIDMVMQDEALGLEEVVVIGYGTQTRKDLTGSIGSIRADDMASLPISSFDQAMQGKLAGVQITQSSGAPGGASTIRIRGFGSISASNEPLYVIDGFPFDNDANESNTGFSRSSFSINPLSMIDPSDIESIDILKDAAAAAIYGSRGANGVVIITTKRGKSGRPTFEFSHYTGWQTATSLPELMNAEEYLDMMVDARNNAWVDGDPANRSATDADAVRAANLRVDQFKAEPLADTDWLDQIFRTSQVANYSLNIRGGSEQINYAINGGYMNQEGIIIGSGFERYSFRANFDIKATPKLSFGFNVAPSYSVHDRSRTEAKGNFVQGSVIHTAISARPSFPVYNEDGTYFNHRASGTPPFLSNPVYIAKELEENVKVANIVSNFFGQYDFTDNLFLKISLGGNMNNVRNHQFVPISAHWPPTEGLTGQAYSFHSQSFSWLNENILNYSKKINDHDFSLMAGYTMQYYGIDRMDASSNNFANNNVKTISAGTQIGSISQRVEEWSMLSYIFRANYSFKDKYLISATARSDGSSRFGADTKFGFFPSASLGWRFTEEDFMAGNSFLDDGKLRVSYGVSGNNTIGNYSKYALLGNTRYVLGSGQAVVAGLSPGSIANDELGWEKTEMINFGLDLYMLNNRLKLVGDYYIKDTKDLLLMVPVPVATGFTSALRNVGAIRNWGWEFMLTSKNVDGQFKWTTDFNISSNKNEILSLGGAGEGGVLLMTPNIFGIGDIFYNEEGKPFSQFYGYVAEGIFQTEEEVLAHKESHPYARPGDYKFTDLNKDGIINAGDRTIIGNALPDFIYGINNNFSYKGFELTVFMQGVAGGDIFNVNGQGLGSLGGTTNQLKAAVNRWRSPEEPGDGFYSRANFSDKNGNGRFSNRWIEDGSFLRVKNINLAYNFKPTLLKSIGFKNARFYVQGTNLFTITDYTGFDPEVSFSNNNPLTQGLDWSVYPLSKTYTIGVNLSF